MSDDERPTKRQKGDESGKGAESGDVRAWEEKYNALNALYTDLKKRENSLFHRLSTKEQEILELQSQVSDLKQSLNTTGNQQVRQHLLDPAVNQQFLKMKSELEQTQKKLQEAQAEIETVNFAPQSLTGKKLVARCKLLLSENEDLGQQLSEGKIHSLETELALQKQLVEELKQNLTDSNNFVTQLDEEVESMQNEIFSLKQQLKSAGH